MSEFLESWQVLIIPITVVIISQFIKVALESKKQGFQWSHLNSYGGMPSSHTAMVVSLATVVGATEGFTSALFFVTCFVGAVFIRDAVGIRQSLGNHGKILNRLIAHIPEDERKNYPRKLDERLGHTSTEALAGGILGIVVAVILLVLI